MYGWVKTDKKGNAINISVKKPFLSKPELDHVIIGTFFFKKSTFFAQALENLYTKNNRINGEFYVDSCMKELIDMKFRVKVFDVDSYICWGTPNDLKTFQYWQRFFHKCKWHAYSRETDHMFGPQGNIR
jgi:UTP-glucose-1-phosphate uridylyltransferase